MKINNKHYEKGVNCPICNWVTDSLYSLEPEDVDKEGMCGDCFAERLVKYNYEVTNIEVD